MCRRLASGALEIMNFRTCRCRKSLKAIVSISAVKNRQMLQAASAACRQSRFSHQNTNLHRASRLGSNQKSHRSNVTGLSASECCPASRAPLPELAAPTLSDLLNPRQVSSAGCPAVANPPSNPHPREEHTVLISAETASLARLTYLVTMISPVRDRLEANIALSQTAP